MRVLQNLTHMPLVPTIHHHDAVATPNAVRKLPYHSRCSPQLTGEKPADITEEEHPLFDSKVRTAACFATIDTSGLANAKASS